MDPETGSERNLANMIFRQITTNKRILTKAVRSTEPTAWDSEIAACLDDLASGNEYRVFRKNSLHPDVFIIGYQLDSLDKTASYLEAMARKGIFVQCAFLAEGYDGIAPMLSRVSPATNSKLNSLYRKYRITPKGKDSFPLRELQYTTLREIEEDLQYIPALPGKIKQAMDCFRQREQHYFLPCIAEHAARQPVIFLTTTAHALSFHLPQLIENKGFGYAVFVPRSL
jgi:hypothetical protein